MTPLELTVVDRGERLAFEPRGVVIAGYTGRDRLAAQRHVEELAAIGVPRPTSIPDINVLDAGLVTLAPTISTGPATSGEVEPVLLFAGGDWYLAVGSDHTDRELEKTNMAAAKSACNKPISAEVYSSSWAAERFGRLVLSSFADGGSEPYQEESCGYFMEREELVALIEKEVGDLDGYVVFCGTVPLKRGAFVYASHFTVELADPTTGEALKRSYRVELGVRGT